jgi:D-sedoheptulose 7-phosphate isomerase
MKKPYFEELLQRYPSLQECGEDIKNSFDALAESFKKGNKLLICGNGGSAADGDHIVGELMKDFVIKRPLNSSLKNQLIDQYGEKGNILSEHIQKSLPAIQLNGNSALSSAFANDINSQLVFAQQVNGYGRKDDVLLAISTSGNSENIIYAVIMAKVLGMKTIGLTGQGGGKLKELCHISICVPRNETYLIQELHLPIYHTLCLMLEQEFFL